VSIFSFLGKRRGDSPQGTPAAAEGGGTEPAYPTKALPKFLSVLAAREKPVLLDLGPVVGSNVNFFGEQLGCKIRVEDIFADIERHSANNAMDKLPAFFASRFTQEPGTVHGILAWDVLDFLDKHSAQALATAVIKLMAPDAALLGFFNTSTQEPRTQVYTKYVVVDQGQLRYRSYPAARPRQKSLQNRDIIRLFEGLRVSDSFLMKTNVREILFRKPAYLAGQ
jgi:hypothetical protein